MSVINRPRVVQILNTFISSKLMKCVIHPASCKQGHFTITTKTIIMPLVVLGGSFLVIPHGPHALPLLARQILIYQPTSSHRWTPALPSMELWRS